LARVVCLKEPSDPEHVEVLDPERSLEALPKAKNLETTPEN
jgi:hypothetical protein